MTIVPMVSTIHSSEIFEPVNELEDRRYTLFWIYGPVHPTPRAFLANVHSSRLISLSRLDQKLCATAVYGVDIVFIIQVLYATSLNSAKRVVVPERLGFEPLYFHDFRMNTSVGEFKGRICQLNREVR